MVKTKVLNFGIAIVILSLVCIAPLCDAKVAPGDLDISFGTNGKVITDFGGDDEAYALAIDSSGKIVVAGYTYASGGYDDFALARYNTDGSLDTTFGTNGKVTTEFGQRNSVAYALAIDSQGRIVAAGVFGSDFALARYHTDGSLDTTFGINGMVTTDFGGGGNVARSLAIDSSGKIVVAGYTNAGGGYDDFALARYNTDGSLDTTFGINGMVTTHFRNYDYLLAVAIDSSGKIVAVGSTQFGGSRDFALARYNTDGSLDTTFGTNGMVTTDFSASDDESEALAIDNQGRTVAAGLSAASGKSEFALARYNIDGSLDTTFGSNGKVTTGFSGYEDYAFGLAIDSNGKIVVAGTASYNDFALARYNIDGTLDATFGTNGKVITDFGGYDAAQAVAIDSGGKIVVAGSTYPSGGDSDFALARYLAGETNPPTGSIMIKGGAAATKSTGVTLTLTASDDTPGAIRMCISNTATCTTWTAFAATKSWTLTTGNGTKTVNVWFKDVWGNVNASPYSDTIILDTIAPTNGTVTATPGNAQVTLDWTGFTDTGSGIGSYKVVFSKVSAPTSCSLGKQIYKGPDTTYTHTGLTNGIVYYYRVCAIDKAGNTSTGKIAKAKPQ